MSWTMAGDIWYQRQRGGRRGVGSPRVQCEPRTWPGRKWERNSHFTSLLGGRIQPVQENQECPGEGRESDQRKMLKMISQVWGEVLSTVVQWMHWRRGHQISEDYVIISGWRYRHWNRDVIVKESDCGAERRPSVQGSQYPLRTATSCAHTAQPCIEISIYQ